MLRPTYVTGLTVFASLIVSAAAFGQQDNRTMNQPPSMWDNFRHAVIGDDTPSAPDNSPPRKAEPYGADRKFLGSSGTSSSDTGARAAQPFNSRQENPPSGNQQSGNQQGSNAGPFYNQNQNPQYNNPNSQYNNPNSQNGDQNQSFGGGNQNRPTYKAQNQPANSNSQNSESFNPAANRQYTQPSGSRPQSGGTQQRSNSQVQYPSNAGNTPGNNQAGNNQAGNNQAGNNQAGNGSMRRNAQPSSGGEAMASDQPNNPYSRLQSKSADGGEAYASDDAPASTGRQNSSQPSPNAAQRSLQDRLNAAQRANQGQPVTNVRPAQGPSAGPLPPETRVAQQPAARGVDRGAPAIGAKSAEQFVDVDATPRSAGEVKSSRRNGAKPLASPIATGVSEGPASLDTTRPDVEVAKPIPQITPSNDTRQAPLLAADTTGPRTIVVGKESAYTIMLRNDGEAAAADVLVNIKIPDWTEVVGSQATSGNTRPAAQNSGEPFQWRIAKLDARGHEQLTLKLIPRKAKPFDLGVQWTFSQASAQSLVEVQEPKLQMALTGPSDVLYGESKVYKLSISNPGSGDAENVILTLPPVGDSQEGPVNHNMGLVKAGETKSVEIELTARQVGNLVLRASATADGGLATSATEDVIVRRAALQLDIEAPKSKLAGTSAVYTIKVSNPGTAPAENVQIVAILPKQAKFLAAGNGGQFVADQGKIVWSMSSIRPGANSEMEVKCQLIGAGQNRLQVTANAGTDLTEVAAANTMVEAVADLKLDVVDPAGPISVGDEVTYEVHLRNRGSKTAQNVDITAFFSNGVRPVAAQGAPYTLFDNDDGQVIFEPITTLPAGHELVLKVRAKVENAGKHTFRTEVKCEALDVNLATSQTMLCYGEDGSAFRAEPKSSTSRGIEARVNEERPLASKSPARLPSANPVPLQNDMLPREAGRSGGLAPRR